MVGMLWLATLVCTAGAAGAELFVAPDGQDQAAGTVEAPLKSLAAAQLRARARTGPTRIVLRGGHYPLAEPLRLVPADSGVTWAAAPGEHPVISGGRRLTGFRVEDGRWVLELPEVREGRWVFQQLFVNGQRRFRPRLPKTGYHYIRKEAAPSPAAEGKGWDRFRFAGEDLRSDWYNLSDVEVLNFNHWNMHRLRIGAVDPERGLVTFTGPTCNTAYWAGLQAGNRFLVENVREALSEPGEFYLDTVTGQLTYLPMPGEDPATAEVIAPQTAELVLLEGDAASGLPVGDVRFEGLTFAYTNWVTPPGGNSFPQAEANLSAAVLARGAQQLAFVGCRFEHLGAWGIKLQKGCGDNEITDCILTDLGAGGLILGTQGIPASEADYAGWTTVRNNVFSHGGRLHPAAHAVWIGHAPHNVVQNNSIYDFYYTGISVGWRWGYAASLAHDNLIADNEIWQIGQGVLSDMGGIYTLGPSPGTVLRHNYLHDINAYTYGGWGVYFDEGSTAIEAVDNLVFRTKTGGFHQHYGKENRVHNNIFAYARIGQIQRTRPEEHRSFVFERNIVLWDEGVLLHGNWSGDQYLLDHNLYWPASGDSLSFAGRSLSDWQAAGQDRNSRVADPGFADPRQGDFTLAAGSPALTVGFVPFPLTGWGSQLTEAGDVLQPVPSAWPIPTTGPPVLPVDEDFVELAIGSKVPGARTFEDPEVTSATARVTAERAASGQQSVKFQDQPGQKDPWNPHLYYDPRLTEGTIETRFDLLLEPGAALTQEWRDKTAVQFQTGPALSVAPGGQLSAGGRELVWLPHLQWVRIVMVAELGGREWTLTVAIHDQPAETFTLPGNPAMKSLGWLGWTSRANQSVAFYVDNIWCGPAE